jgi:F-type H+-transporting ATPase subunit epsilon
MRVSVISAERSVFAGEASAVVAPAYDGLVGILPRHAPFMTLLGKGIVTIHGSEGTKSVEVSGGFLQVSSDVVRVVARSASATEA